MHPCAGPDEKKTAPVRVRQGPVKGNGRQISHHALGRAVMVVRDTVFVLDDLSVQLVDQLVDGRIQILVGTFSKQVIAFDMNVAFGPLAFFLFLLFFNSEQDFDIDHLVKMSRDAV